MSDIKVKIQLPYGNLFRKRHTLIVCKDLDGKFLLGNKPDFFPEGITRFLGGGIDEGEEEASSAARELSEELGIIASTSDLELMD
ncbi:MAG: NUDIX domain-containing protein [Candidatus Dojkabacteria bacterium]|nr:NUDIX domain-containing protein [Candidatus Dojkabacteria bacterium]MDQ7020862.1 NUDIX domain-containing protein [Candidatus Dojkabacteria bacterium]